MPLGRDDSCENIRSQWTVNIYFFHVECTIGPGWLHSGASSDLGGHGAMGQGKAN